MFDLTRVHIGLYRNCGQYLNAVMRSVQNSFLIAMFFTMPWKIATSYCAKMNGKSVIICFDLKLKFDK